MGFIYKRKIQIFTKNAKKLLPHGSEHGTIWLVGQLCLTPVFVNEVAQPRRWFTYCRATVLLQWQSWVVTTEMLWPAQPKIFATLPFPEKFYQALDMNIFVNTTNTFSP